MKKRKEPPIGCVYAGPEYFGKETQGMKGMNPEQKSYPENLLEEKEPEGIEAAKVCPDCGAKYITKNKYCMECGSPLVLEEKE